MKGGVKMSKNPIKTTQNLEQSIIQFCGVEPKKPFIKDGKFWNRFGPNNKWGAVLHDHYAVVWDWTTGERTAFQLKGHENIRITIQEPKEISTLTEDFYKLSKQPIYDHPYLLKKNIDIKDLNIRWQGRKIVIPVFSPQDFICSWQTIDAQGEKRFKKGHILPKGRYFPFGQSNSEKIYIAEGFATSATIHTITKSKVYCAFSKGNLDNVVQYCLKKYPKKEIRLCLDNDKEKTHKTNIQDKRLITLCPEKKGDFNDLQNDANERIKLIVPPNELYLFITESFKNIPREKPFSFYKQILLHYEFNFCYGASKIGKTRALIYCIWQALRPTQYQCAIISTENDKNKMFSPLFKNMECEKTFINVNDQIVKHFPKPTLTGAEKINIFSDRLRKYLSINTNIACLLLDPLPRFFDWNQETLATTMIDNLRDIARTTQTCIIGVRNEGKNTSYETEHRYKGSSGITDHTRQSIRALKCHPKSELGKEVGKFKSFVLYTELSSLYGEQAFLFKLKIEKDGEYTTAVPEEIRAIKNDTETIKYLCTRESGKKLSSKIFTFINKTPEKTTTLQDLYDEFGDIYSEQVIRNCVHANFIVTHIGGISIVELKTPSPPKKDRKHTSP